jgi:hypothetical protein
MGAVHVLRGTTFSSAKDRAGYSAEGCATMTLRELEHWLALEFLGKYHHRVRAELKRPPARRLDRTGCFQPGSHAQGPHRASGWATALEMRRPRRDGFHLFNIRDWSAALVKLLGRHEQKLMVRFDAPDLSRVWIRRPDGRHVEGSGWTAAHERRQTQHLRHAAGRADDALYAKGNLVQRVSLFLRVVTMNRDQSAARTEQEWRAE